MSDSRRRDEIAARARRESIPFEVAGKFYDYWRGVELPAPYVGLVLTLSGTAIMRTWIDRATGERAWECVAA